MGTQCYLLSSLIPQQLCSSFEIFHMRESDVPVDTIEIKGAFLFLCVISNYKLCY